MINQQPYSNAALITPQYPPVNVQQDIPNQNEIYTKISPYPDPQIPPQNYQLIPNQTPIMYQPMPMQIIPSNIVEPPAQLPKSLDMIELYEDLAEVRKAEVLKYFQGGHKYRVKIEYQKNMERNIFIGKRNSSINGTYDFEIRMKYIPRDSTEEILNTKDFENRHFDIDSHDLFGYKPKIYIINKEDKKNIIWGGIEQKRCCTCCCRDPNIEIYPYYLLNSFPKYFVTTNGCQCSYCCCDDCPCSYGMTNFQIYDTTKSLLVGNIIKTEYDYEVFLRYNIEFPPDAPPEDKILIIFTAIAIDNIDYKLIGGHIK